MNRYPLSINNNPPQPGTSNLEKDPRFRASLLRSINRCDQELAAVAKLHDSLHDLKAKLAKEENPTVRQEFQWKMQLRRRLLNRIARRMFRLSFAMDGNVAAIAPPLYAKYGDNPYSFAEHREDFDEFRRSKAASQPSAAGLSVSPKLEDDVGSENEEGGVKKTDKEPVEIEYDVGYDDDDEEVEDDSVILHKLRLEGLHLVNRGYQYPGEMGLAEKLAEYKRWRTELLDRVPNQCTFDEIQDKTFREMVNQIEEENATKAAEEAAKKESPAKKIKLQMKEGLQVTKKIDQEVKQDHEQPSSSVGEVKSESTHIENVESSEISNLMGGNIVPKETGSTSEPNTSTTPIKEEENAMDVVEDKKEPEAKEIELDSDVESRGSKRKGDELALAKPKKPFSLKPVPSFFDQDWRRVRGLHSYLLETASRSLVESRIADVAKEYNASYQKSLELHAQREKMRVDMQRLHLWNQTQANSVNQIAGNRATHIAIAKANYQRRKESFEVQMIARRKQMEFRADEDTRSHGLGGFIQLSVGASLMSIVDQIVTKQDLSASRAEKEGERKDHPPLGNTLSNAVESVIARVTDSGKHPHSHLLKFDSSKKSDYLFETFVSPLPENDGTNEIAKMKQMHQRSELAARAQLEQVMQQIMQVEELRAKAWRKLLKVKAETEPNEMRRRVILHSAIPPLRPGGHFVPSKSNIAISLPPERSPVPVAPSGGAGGGVATTTPSGGSSKYGNRYSKANVRARVYPDGSVAPIQVPQKDKNGLYMRPLGRQRKGMDWDAKRGRWVPI